ncbi:MAG: SpoIIE family protein phosphatase [Thermotogota bacterium]|nr:SpoIIE family protein phosphatase [Thermotogota bacterium]
MEKEIAMSRKLAEDPLVRKWMINQKDMDLTQLVQEQLDSYRDFISSGTHFMAVKSSLNYSLEDIEQPAKTLKKDLTADRWFFEPLDIVGGDFYFLKQTNEDIWLAGIDCTGHGVSGAFMTMMANVLLKDIIEANSKVGPDQILQQFHYKLKDSLKSSSNFDHLDNGLDMSLCKIYGINDRLEFSGAGLPFIYSDENGVHEIRGDSLHIGYNIDKDYSFTKHTIKIKAGMTGYLLTDGILDLPGGEKGFGLGRSGLINILESVSRLPLKEQEEAIKKQLKTYKGNYHKKDDLLLMGFRL